MDRQRHQTPPNLSVSIWNHYSEEDGGNDHKVIPIRCSNKQEEQYYSMFNIDGL